MRLQVNRQSQRTYPKACVLLDVSTQLLEPQNQGVAALWLEVDHHLEIEVAMFVESKDNLWVLRHDGMVELLVLSHI